MPIHTGRLVLTPADPLLAPLTQDLRQTLEQLGFLGPSLPAARAALVRHGQGIIQSLGSDQDPDQGAHPCAGQGRSHGFLAGEQFLALLAFAGCSVNVDLAPKPGGGPFTHIRLLGPLPQPRLLAGRNTRPPRCPRCRTPYRDWQPALPPPSSRPGSARPAPGSDRPGPGSDRPGPGTGGIRVAMAEASSPWKKSSLAKLSLPRPCWQPSRGLPPPPGGTSLFRTR